MFERRRKKLKVKLSSIEIVEESLSLELQIWKYFKCGECDVDLANPGRLKFHMKLFMKPEITKTDENKNEGVRDWEEHYSIKS